MKRTPKILLAGIALISIQFNAPSAQGTENREHNNLLLGVGIGAGCEMIRTKLYILQETSYGNLKVHSSMITDGRVGYMINEHFELSGLAHIDWTMPYTALIAAGTISLNSRCYFNRTPPTLFIDFSPGYGVWLYPINWSWNERYAGWGTSVATGLGYEYSKRVSFHVGYQYFCPVNRGEVEGRSNDYGPGDKIGYTQTYSTNTIRFTMWYALR